MLCCQLLKSLCSLQVCATTTLKFAQKRLSALNMYEKDPQDQKLTRCDKKEKRCESYYRTAGEVWE